MLCYLWLNTSDLLLIRASLATFLESHRRIVDTSKLFPRIHHILDNFYSTSSAVTELDQLIHNSTVENATHLTRNHHPYKSQTHS